MNASPSEFLQRLRKFVQREAETQHRTLEKQWSYSLQERVAKGWAIEGLRVEQVKNGLIRLSCTTNDSRFREGDLVLLHQDGPHDPDALHCELQYDGETDLEVSLIRGNEVFLSSRSDGWVVDQDWFDSSSFYLDALNAVADSQLGRSKILPLLQNSLRPKIDYARYERARQELCTLAFCLDKLILSVGRITISQNIRSSKEQAMPDSDYNQLVTNLSRDIVARMAPEELPLYPLISEAYVKDPEKTLKGQISKDEDLGFGVAEAAVLLTPVVLDVMKSVVMFLGAEIAKRVKEESSSLIGDYIKSMFKKYVPANTSGKQIPGLTSEQLAQVRLLALEKARQLSLTEDQAVLLSDSIIGSLAVTPA